MDANVTASLIITATHMIAISFAVHTIALAFLLARAAVKGDVRA